MTRATSASVRLFVYGSLKRAGRHHDVLQAAAATFLGEAETVPGYRLIALGEYLALVPAPPGAPGPPCAPCAPNETETEAEPAVVEGELYEVPESQLPALDAFEGDAYMRGKVQIRLRASHAPAHAMTIEESLAYFEKAR